MIFRYLSDKEYVTDYFKTLPNNGRGQAKRLAEHLGVSSVVVSQTLNGQRDWSVENAFSVTKFLKLTPIETQYFLKMVDYGKAGNHELKNYLLAELKQLQREGKKVQSRYNKTQELNDEDKFQFY